VTRAVTEVLDALPFAEGDPRRVTAEIAKRLAEAFDAKPSAGVARELNVCLSYLTDAPSDRPTQLDELRARRAARIAGLLLEPVMASDFV
jgi:hypothetical protein